MLNKTMRMLFILNSTFFILNSAAIAAGYKLPDTGQTKCYQAESPYDEIDCAGTGQDGAYGINPMSFTDNGNGTVTDNNTGLVWQKCSVGQNNDASCGGTAATYNWYQASGTYDATNNPDTSSVCGSLTLADGGWRLPSKKELTGIIDYNIPNPGPTLRQEYFPNSVASFYWSSTTYAYYPSQAWGVWFWNGYVENGNKNSNKHYYRDAPYYVRCVRGGQ